MKRMIGYIWLACLLLRCAFGLDPSRSLTQYGHTAWRVRDGYFSAPPMAIAQTKDGQLWLGGEGGLLRFDGVQFSPWKPPTGQALPDEHIYGLLGASDGSLWIGTGDGLARWKDNKLTVYAKAGRFSALLEDHLGTIWAGHTRALGVVPPLCRFSGNEFKCFALSDNPGLSWVGALKEDHNGDLWIATVGAVCRRKSTGETNCYSIPTSKSMGAPGGVQYMAVDSDDDIWLDGGFTGIWQLKSGRWKHYDEFPRLKLQMRSSLVDHEGGLWFGDQNHGLIRHVEGRVEQFDRTDGLSGDTVTAMFEDREGSVWTATSTGLDRFRDVKVATITRREGLPLSSVGSVVASRDGSLWIAGASELVHAKFDKAPSYEAVRGLPENGDFGTMFEDSRGRLWLGVGHTLIWRENSQFHKVYSLEFHQPGVRVRAISEDKEGNIWAATTDPEFALVRVRDGRLLEQFTVKQVGGQISAMVADPKGGMWISLSLTPGLLLAHDGKFERHAPEFPGPPGNMFVDSNGLWAATKKGLVSYDKGILNILDTKNGLPCDELNAAIKDDSGALWLKGTCGLIQISASELELWLKDPGRRVQLRYLDAFDGTQSGTSAFAHVTKTSDGRIWFALVEVGVQVVDPKRLQDNPTAPPVAVTNLVADHRPYDLNSKLRLPALTRDLEIDYTAYSLMIPEKVHFRYRLEGVDQSWQDVGSRRQAYFANLKPGFYRFSVAASNNDGVWNEQGAKLDFSIAPAFYQTAWFKAACVLAILGCIYLAYRLRVQQLSRQLRVRMYERLAERTRIAQELHDTLLQSFQGLMLRFQGANEILLSNPSEAKEALESALDRADQALTESRRAIQGIRADPFSDLDLEHTLRAIMNELAADELLTKGKRPTTSVVVEGKPRNVDPGVREEICKIAREAFRNAFTHGDAQHIESEIAFSNGFLRVRFRDDGVGIDAAVLKVGVPAGHWGLTGMKERAKRLRGQLNMWSKPGAGTEVELMVPAHVAFEPGPSWVPFKKKRRGNTVDA
jgi:signal transduction histidine kinase/ligand-binding sensor domain-containing protein